jgi:hypothetical protein
VQTLKLLLGFIVIILFISCVFAFLGQSTRPLLADGAIVPLHVSYSPMDAIPSPSGSMARTKKIRLALSCGWRMHKKIPTAVLDSVGQVYRQPIATIRDLNLPFQNNPKRDSPSSAVINQFDLDQRKEVRSAV